MYQFSRAIFRELALPYTWDDDQPPSGHGSHPVVLVTYVDAAAYCDWLSEELGRAVRLPTEAEWERAARGGLDGYRYPWGNDVDPTRCNYLTDASAKRQRGTRPTGTYPPNGFGLYDVCGNVWEWVADWYGPDYYGVGEMNDPRGPESGSMRRMRPGNITPPSDTKMAWSAYATPDQKWPLSPSASTRGPAASSASKRGVVNTSPYE